LQCVLQCVLQYVLQYVLQCVAFMGSRAAIVEVCCSVLQSLSLQFALQCVLQCVWQHVAFRGSREARGASERTACIFYMPNCLPISCPHPFPR